VLVLAVGTACSARAAAQGSDVGEPAWRDQPFLIAAEPGLPAPPPDELERIVRHRTGMEMDEFLRRSAAFGFSGAVLAHRTNSFLVRAGYGIADRAAGTPVSASTRFDAGSIAKSFTAAAVLRLGELGKLDLDAPVRRVLDFVPERLDAVTPRMLMTHTSGMPAGVDFSGVGSFEDRDAVVLAAMGSIDEGALGPEGAPFEYANPNYFVLAAIIEKTWGGPLERAMRDLLFDRLELARTGLVGEWMGPAVIRHAPAAIGYSDAPRSRRSDTTGTPADDSVFAWGHKGATGVVTTTTDLYRWARALQGPAVLTESSRRVMFTPGSGGYGCGWFVARREIEGAQRLTIWHTGGTVGFTSSLAFWPEEGAVLVVLSNTTNGTAAPVTAVLERLLFGGGALLPPKAAEPPVPVETLAGLAGRYAVEGGVLVVSFDEDARRLTVHAEGQGAVGVLAEVDERWADDLEEFHEQARESLGAFVGRDIIPILSYTHDQVPESAVENWIRRWASVDGGAQLERVEVLGTAPGELGPLTFVRLIYAEGRSPEVVRVLWNEGRIAGLSRSPRGGPGALDLVAESPATLAGLDPRTWRTTRLEFTLGEDGRPASVRVLTDRGVTETRL
jgi:CubicO group peptidase (beta-lactamase class C family)